MFKLASLVVSTFAVLSFGAAAADAQPFAPSRFSVDVRGEGPDVILIPGLGSSRDVWDAQVAALEGTHRLHLVQVAGFAGEAAPASTQSMIDPLVEELAEYIESYTTGEPAIIGHSMGGLTGLILARRHPERVSRVMIVDSLPFFSAMFGPQATAAGVEPQARMMRDQLIALDAASFAAQQQMGAGRLVKTESYRPTIIGWSVASDRTAFAQAMYEVMTTDMRAEVANVQTPLTIVYAYDPAMGPEAMIDGLYRGGFGPAPNATFVRVDGSYHFIMIDQPEAFQAAVANFLR